MSLDRPAADRLNDQLDAMVASNATPPPDSDAQLARTAERFFAADDAPAPPPGLANQVWEELMHQNIAPLAQVSGFPA